MILTRESVSSDVACRVAIKRVASRLRRPASRLRGPRCDCCKGLEILYPRH